MNLTDHKNELSQFQKLLLKFKLIQLQAESNKSDEYNRLVAFIKLTEQSKAFDEVATRNQLEKKLPSYMIPSVFQIIEEFPYNTNGKIDKKVLQIHKEPTSLQKNIPTSIEALDPDKQKLLEIWQQLLANPKLGIHDDFFRSGGDSILAIRVISKARAAGLEFSVTDLFRMPTVDTLITHIQSSTEVEMEEGEL